jgi:hypothetical protein
MKYSLIVICLLLVACGRGPQGEQGVQGVTGATGPTGANGSSCTVQQANNGAIISCTDGTSVLVLNGRDGIDGTNGADGKDGVDGKDGTNGLNGTNGINALPTAYSIKEIIDPCGTTPNTYNEVLLRLENGTLVGYFEDGGARFLATISPGYYETTDKSKCKFTVHTDMTVTW